MKFLTALISVILWMGSNVSYAQSIDQTELFSALNAIRTDRSCNATEAKKLFYFRKGPKSRTSYQVEKDVLSGIQEVFPDQSFFDVSGLGLIAKLDQGSSGQYVDMIKTSLKAVNEPGLYIHADFSNLEGSDMLEIQAWTIDRQSGSLDQACLKRSILFADQKTESDPATQNKGIIIQGDVSNSGAGDVNITNQNISNTNLKIDDAITKIDNIDQARRYLSVATDPIAAAKFIPISIAYQLLDEELKKIRGTLNRHKSNAMVNVYDIFFHGGYLSYTVDGSGFISYKNWWLEYLDEDERWKTSIVREEVNSSKFVNLSDIGVVLGVDDFHTIAGKMSCLPATTYAYYGDFYMLECYNGWARDPKIYLFQGSAIYADNIPRLRLELELMNNSEIIPTRVSVFDALSICHEKRRELALFETDKEYEDLVNRYGDVVPNCIANPGDSWVSAVNNNTESIPRELYDDFDKLKFFRLDKFVSQRYLLSNWRQNPDPELQQFDRTADNFRKLYKPNSQVFYLDNFLPVNDVIRLKMKPGDAGWDILYRNPTSIKLEDQDDDRGILYFSVSQTIANGCKVFGYDLNFEIEIFFNFHDIFVLSEKVERVGSRDVSYCK